MPSAGTATITAEVDQENEYSPFADDPMADALADDSAGHPQDAIAVEELACIPDRLAAPGAAAAAEGDVIAPLKNVDENTGRSQILCSPLLCSRSVLPTPEREMVSQHTKPKPKKKRRRVDKQALAQLYSDLYCKMPRPVT